MSTKKPDNMTNNYPDPPKEPMTNNYPDPPKEPMTKNRDNNNKNDVRMKDIEDLNSAQNIQISNIQEQMTRMEQNIQNIEDQNKDTSIEDKMKQTLNELRKQNDSSKKDIKMNKKNININNKNIKRINQLNKTIEELYGQKNVMAEEDEIMVGGNNTIRTTVEKIFNRSMNGGEKNTHELAVDIFHKQVPLENNGNNYGTFEKNEYFKY